ncbi:SufE family protein [Synechococcus sp. W60.1]|uniref:SufE family protein n=1 Tax=Synechococcus sp. W60.1 TaxID=2964516 RepID=UPI0039C254E0
MPAALQQIVNRFQKAKTSRQKYELLLAYAKRLPPFPEAERKEENLGCVDLSFEPKESTDEIEKTQEVPGQFVKTRK